MIKSKQCYFCAANLKVVDFRDSVLLKKFMTPQGKISVKRKTGACSLHQRKPSAAPAFWAWYRLQRASRRLTFQEHNPSCEWLICFSKALRRATARAEQFANRQICVLFEK